MGAGAAAAAGVRVRLARSDKLGVHMPKRMGNHNSLERGQCPLAEGRGEGRHALVADVVAVEGEMLPCVNVA